MEENEELLETSVSDEEATVDLGDTSEKEVIVDQGIRINEPTEEQLAFQAKVEALGLEKGDVVVFRNGEIGRIDAFNFLFSEMNYRVYVRFGTAVATLNEELLNVAGDKRYDAQKVLSSDFTTIKKENVFTEVILTKEEAEAKLSEAEGQTIIIE